MCVFFRLVFFEGFFFFHFFVVDSLYGALRESTTGETIAGGDAAGGYGLIGKKRTDPLSLSLFSFMLALTPRLARALPSSRAGVPSLRHPRAVVAR